MALGRDVSAALAGVGRVSEGQVLGHARALAWRERLPFPHQVVWLPVDWVAGPEGLALRPLLLSPAARATAAHHEADRPTRVAHFVADRFALALASRQMGGGESCSLHHTRLGQPVARRARADDGPPVRVSFTHDGGSHLTLTAAAPGLRAVGIDAVHLPRLRRVGKDDAHLRRFAARFMGPDERERFTVATAGLSGEPLLLDAAARFSLMEAASKALGTGLRIGGGIGREGSLPMSSIAADPAGRVALQGPAAARMRALRSRRLEGHWSSDGEYLVSIALLWDQF